MRQHASFLALLVFTLIPSPFICSTKAQSSAPDAIFSVTREGFGSQLPASGWSDSNGGTTGAGGAWFQSLGGNAGPNSANMTATMSLTGESQLFDVSANYKVTVYVKGDSTSTVSWSGSATAQVTSDGIPRATASGGAIPYSGGASATADKPYGAPGSDSDSNGGGGSNFSNIGCGGVGSLGTITVPEYPGVVYRVPPGGHEIPFGAGIRNDGPTASDVSLDATVSVGVTVELGDDTPVAIASAPHIGGTPATEFSTGTAITYYNHSFDPDNLSGSTPLSGICSTVWTVTAPNGAISTYSTNTSLTFTPTMGGKWTVDMVVTDNEGDSASAGSSVSVYVDIPKPNPGSCERNQAKFQRRKGTAGGINSSTGNFNYTWFDPVSTRGFPLEVNIHFNTQTNFPSRVTEFGNAAFTYGIAVTTLSIDGIDHWYLIDADGQELNYGPTASAPAGTAGIFSQLDQIGGGYELINAGPPESIDQFGNYSYVFDSYGRLISLTDPAGNLQTITRDGSGNILEVLDQSSGRTIEFEYDTLGVVARIIEGNGEAVTHLDQTSGKIDAITLKDAPGNVIRQLSITYSPTNGLISTIHKDSQQVASINYFDMGDGVYFAQFNRSSGGGSNLNYFVAPTAGVARRVEHTTADGGIEVYDFGPNGQLLKKTLPKFNGATIAPVITYAYNANLQMTSRSNGITNETFTFNSLGQLTGSTISAGQSMSYTYSGANLLSMSDQDGTIGTYAFTDPINPNSPTTYTDAGGNTWTYAYNQYGQLLSITPPSGSPEGQMSLAYNETTGHANFGYLESIVDGIGNATEFDDYTAMGDVGSISTSPQTGITNTTTFEYDSERRRTGVTHPDTKQQSFTYDGHFLESSVDENAQITSYTYCASCGALEGISMPLGKSLGWEYGDDLEQVSFTDANTNQTTYAYGKAKELKRETFPDAQYLNYSYDRYGRVEKLTDNTTRQHTYTYTNTGRLSRIAMTNPWQNANSFYYHADGRYSSLDDEAGVTTYTYNSNRKLTRARYNFTRTGLSRNQDVDYTYFPDGKTQTMTWRDNGTNVVVWTYGYDAAGKMTTVTDSFGATVTYAYDGEGKIVTQTNSNGTSTDYSYYQPRGWVSSIVHKSGGTPFQSFAMEFDGGANTVGNITKVTELDGSEVDYVYDDLYRLTSEDRTGTHAFNRTYGYDLANNITTINGSAFATYDAANKIATVAGGSASSDGIGNMTAISGTGLTSSTYTWNSMSNLRTQNAGGGNTTYYYNALQYRVHKRPPTGGGAAHRWYVFDQNGLLVGEASTAGAQVAYTWGADGLVARRQISGGVINFYHGGPQAEIRNLTNSSGAVTDSYWYSVYGKSIATSGSTTNPYRFGGKVGYYNDGGSHSYLATWRWYNSEIGRWLSRDPIGYSGGENQFSYVGGRPMNEMDPSGLATTLCFFTEGAKRNGHLGFKVTGEYDTQGLYPDHDKWNGNRFYGPGIIRPDVDYSENKAICKVIDTTETQENCLKECRRKWREWGGYAMVKGHCGHYIKDCFKRCELKTGDSYWPADIFNETEGITLPDTLSSGGSS